MLSDWVEGRNPRYNGKKFFEFPEKSLEEL
jgi:hypothetical protein